MKEPTQRPVLSDTRLQVNATACSISSDELQDEYTRKFTVAKSNVTVAAFERVKQDESDNRGEIYFRAMRSRPTRPIAGNRDVGSPPYSEGVWLELIKHLKGSDTLTAIQGHSRS